MEQSERINFSAFIDEMQWLVPSREKNEYGEVKTIYTPGKKFLAEVLKCERGKEKKEKEESLTLTLQFRSWEYPVNTSYKVLFSEVEYDLKEVHLLQRGLFAEYLCKNEDYVTG